MILTAAMIFTTLFSLNMVAGAASFSPRYEAPSYSNAYYYSDKNLYYSAGYGMPNCTAYAYGRAYEILGHEPNLCPYNAELWYGWNQSNGYYNYGQQPAIGAIACWSYPYGGGHVAVVEDIDSNGNLTLSNSAWSGIEFYLTYADASEATYNPGGSSWWNFQGYIYVYKEPGEGYTAETTQPKNYSTGTYVVDVDDTLNMRSGAGAGYSYVTSVKTGTKLNVTDIERGGSYTWGKTSYNGKSGWVALDYCEFISEEFQTEPATEAPTEAPTQAPTVAPTTAKATEPTEQTTTVPRQKPTKDPDLGPKFEPVTEPKEIKGSPGDVNADGKLSIEDVTIIQKELAGVANLSDEAHKWCDVDFNGVVNIADATKLQKVINEIYE